MRQRQFTEAQKAFALRQAESWIPVSEVLPDYRFLGLEPGLSRLLASLPDHLYQTPPSNLLQVLR